MTAEPDGRRGATGATTVGFHESPWGLPRPPGSAASPRWPSRSPPGCGKTEFPDAMGESSVVLSGGWCFSGFVVTPGLWRLAALRGAALRSRGTAALRPRPAQPWHIPGGVTSSRHRFRGSRRSRPNPRRGCLKGKLAQTWRRAFSRGSSCETGQAGAVTPSRCDIAAQETIATQPQNRN